MLPTYEYRPSPRPGQEPKLRTCSSLRARLFAGGTYFRARVPGQLGNRLTVAVIEYPDTSEAVCVITNYAMKADELVTGPASVEFFDFQLKTHEAIDLYSLDTMPAAARKYSISFKIAPPPPVYTELGSVRTLSLVSLPGMLAATVTPDAPSFTPSDVVTITPRKRVYHLVAKTYVDPVDFTVYQGWDIDLLRTQVNADNPWVEMLPRSGGIDDGMGNITPNPNPPDHQDPGLDAPVLSAFAETSLGGGDGVPSNPDREITGPSRSIVHVNYGEAQNGLLNEVNTVYEWNGRNSVEGSWVGY